MLLNISSLIGSNIELKFHISYEQVNYGIQVLQYWPHREIDKL